MMGLLQHLQHVVDGEARRLLPRRIFLDAGGAAHYKEPARDFLSGADFGERTESGRI